ncbi:uncharacterized protein LOC127266593 [Andrographis paniculata]|uniref:uncharacterized protein LOC127266593 n=1 Tax=Andrographis paniculata TaxID=175694 RepID=UPI0021E80C99|nr:uncharacterized protein LOC127266593 [Andrographis paniculata]
MARTNLFHYTPFLVAILLILLQFYISSADRDDDENQRPPFVSDGCNGAACGRGKCVPSTYTLLGFECECEEGWMQARAPDANFLKFLPCVIPNCTLNYTCEDTDHPREYPNNPSIPRGFPNYPYNPNLPHENPNGPNIPREYPNNPGFLPNNPESPNNPGFFPNNPESPNNPRFPNNPGFFPNNPEFPPNNPGFPREFPNNPNNPGFPNNPRFPNNPEFPPNNPGFPREYPNDPDNNGPNNFFNPCSFNDCGGGLCSVMSPITHSCICREGFYNLFNATIFPCYRECAFGAGCSGLRINTTTSVLDPNPVLQDNGEDLIGGAEVGCLVAVVTTLANIIFKLI